MKLGKVLLLTAAVLGTASSLAVTDVQAKTGYHRTKNTAVKPKAFYSTSKHGATYQANGSLTNFKFKKNHALTHYRDSTWVATSKTYIKMHGKNHLYYYVHNSDGKAQGWVWSGYLKAGKHNQMRHEASKQVGNYVMAKPGKLYQFGGGYRTKNFNPLNIRFKHGIKLSDKVTYKRTQLWTVYKHGKASKYYYVTSSDNQVKGWVWHGFLKPGEVKEEAKKPAPVVTKPNNSVSNNQGNVGNTVTNTKPTVPAKKPTIPEWATDDGKRARIVINAEEFDEYIDEGLKYSFNVSMRMELDGERKIVSHLEKLLDESSPYHIRHQLYGVVDGKKIVLDYLSSPILTNGDILYHGGDEFYTSVGKPELTRQYSSEGKDVYKTWAPTWYQYHQDSRDFSIWQFNLRTRHWDETDTHQTHVIAG